MKKTIIVTGATGNLGHNLTEHLIGQGHRVLATVRGSEGSVFTPRPELSLHELNVLDAESAADWVGRITAEQPVDALVCLVGGFAAGSLAEADRGTILKMIDLNFFSAYHLVQPLVARHRELGRPLQLVFIGSRAAILPAQGKDLLAYSLSKSLLLRLAEFINEETNATGIQASVILPSTLDTPATRHAMPDADFSDWVPLQRVSETVDFILSEPGRMLRSPIFALYNQA